MEFYEYFRNLLIQKFGIQNVTLIENYLRGQPHLLNNKENFKIIKKDLAKIIKHNESSK